ncbi:MAG: CNNM domain-containing protein [Mycetocola sp.]
MNTASVIIITVLLIVASAFFVIIEFALLGARRQRLEQDAPRSASARAALRGMNELTMMLAVAQLGITVCTFALGAITKPAVDGWLLGPLTAIGLPDWLADVASFAIALIIVTFLHLVIGEMMPKSWAIAYPERAAKLVAIPARGLETVLRPLLVWINKIANRLVAASGITPVERAAVGGQDIDTIRQLVEQSADAGTIDTAFQRQFTEILDLQRVPLRDVARGGTPTQVEHEASAAELWDVVATSGHMRILVGAADLATLGVVHVRDTLALEPTASIQGAVRPALILPADIAAGDAFRMMRDRGEQLAVLTTDGRVVGVATVADVLHSILPGPASTV